MDFYASIAPFYDYIFPYKPVQLEFTLRHTGEQNKQHRLLDIGCATGNLAIHLAHKSLNVTGIDLDEEMIHYAQKKAKGIEIEPGFEVVNMLQLEKHYSAESFNSILCYGNTLVHLDNTVELLDFFKQTYSCLTTDGVFLFQIINYDRILNENIKGLPTIENEHIQFKRDYNFLKEKNKIQFDTTLTVKSQKKIIRNRVELLPIKKDELSLLLHEAGFDSPVFYGSFLEDKLTNNSVMLLGAVKKR